MRRRAFLGASAGVVGGALLSGCASGPYETDVAIIGGGIAGITAAYRLKQLSISAVVYDAASRVGGRMRTDRTTFAGQRAEVGGEHVSSTHATVLALCSELGIPLYDDASAKPGANVYRIGGVRLSQAQIDDGLGAIASALAAARATLGGDTVSYSTPNGATGLDRLTLAEWLDAVSITGPVRTLFEVQSTVLGGLDPDQLAFLDVLLAPPRDDRYRIAAGSDALTGEMTATLSEAQVVLEHRLLAVAPLSDGRLRLTFDRGGSAVDIKVGRVVFALPFSTLRECTLALDLPPLQRRAIDELGYGTSSKLVCGFGSRVWTAAGESGSTVSDLYQQSFDSSFLQGGASGILSNDTGGRHGVELGSSTAGAAATGFMAQLDGVIPGTATAYDGRAVLGAWPYEPFAKGSRSVYLPMQRTTFGGIESAQTGNVYFCGEHTSGDFMGTMEGGASSGTRVATQIARDLGLVVSR